MRKSAKIVSLLFACVMLIAVFTACGSGNTAKNESSNAGSSNDTQAEMQKEDGLTEAVGSVVSAKLPDGWILKAGKDIDVVGYVDEADYIIKGSDVDTSAPTLQVAVASQSSDSIDTWKDWIDGESFGSANEPFEVNGITWYTAKEGGAALIDGQVCVVYNLNGAAFTDETVQTILGSITWVK
ncbi:MAG: hypothetical protein IJ072_08520 [Oscillospiraceae bacterium]|nr:hypothetical protein [Oscillospiraceae bacterium]